MNIPNSTKPRVVIIGGGFAGISLAKNLKKSPFQVILLDKNNYHTFQPLLYQVATGGLEPDAIAYPIRKIFQEYPDFYFRLADVKHINPEKNILTTDVGTLIYDYLVIATGAETNFFGNKTIEQNSMTMKSVPQALNIRSFVLENFEQALLTTDLDEQKSLMNFVLVGGGPTGVELAGALAEMKKAILPKDYPDLDLSNMQINLIQSGDRILNTMTEKSSVDAEKFLKNLGVTIWKNIRVTGYDGKIITTNTDKIFDASTVIWAAGVKGSIIDGLTYNPKANRYTVNLFNQIEGFSNVFALGDVALMVSEKYPQGHPMMAQPALQQGSHLAENLCNLNTNKPLEPFVYNDKGSMATVGRNKAVVDLPKYTFTGFWAWIVWMFVHLFSLIGFKNKIIVFVNWTYNYIKFDRAQRLIIRPFKKKQPEFFTFDEV